MKRYWLLTLLVAIITAACGPAPAVNEAPAAPATATATEPASTIETPAPTSAMTVIDEYPAPATDGYPPPGPPVPAAHPYPAAEGMVWIIIPVGEQCADPSENSYASLQDAVASLTAAGITVNTSTMTDLPVCMACGCPTSAHYRLQIDAASLNDALSLGWLPVEDEE